MDGLGLIFGREIYQRYHHVLSHNIPFAIAGTLLAARWVGRSPGSLLRIFACFLLHFWGDYWGSGPGWPLYLLKPFSDTATLNPHAWQFNGPESQFILLLLLVLSVLIARRENRSPFETLHRDFDTRFLDACRLVRLTPCHCGLRAIAFCHACRQSICAAHARFETRYRASCSSDCRSRPG